MRQEYWIPQGHALIKKTLKNCQICKRIEGKPFVMPEMPPLPRARSLPFEFTGLGPLYIKQFVQVSDSKKVKLSLTGQSPYSVQLCQNLISCFLTFGESRIFSVHLCQNFYSLFPYSLLYIATLLLSYLPLAYSYIVILYLLLSVVIDP